MTRAGGLEFRKAACARPLSWWGPQPLASAERSLWSRTRAQALPGGPAFQAGKLASSATRPPSGLCLPVLTSGLLTSCSLLGRLFLPHGPPTRGPSSSPRCLSLRQFSEGSCSWAPSKEQTRRRSVRAEVSHEWPLTLRSARRLGGQLAGLDRRQPLPGLAGDSQARFWENSHPYPPPPDPDGALLGHMRTSCGERGCD